MEEETTGSRLEPFQGHVTRLNVGHPEPGGVASSSSSSAAVVVVVVVAPRRKQQKDSSVTLYGQATRRGSRRERDDRSAAAMIRLASIPFFLSCLVFFCLFRLVFPDSEHTDKKRLIPSPPIVFTYGHDDFIQTEVTYIVIPKAYDSDMTEYFYLHHRCLST